MNTHNTTEALPSAQSRLPALDKQNIKYAHFRYKAIPVLDGKNKMDFFEKVELPNYETYCSSTKQKENACLFPYGGMSAAFKIDPDTGVVEVGMSKCSILDTYNKSTGRMISSGRFSNAKHPHVRFASLLKMNINMADKIGVVTEDRNASSIARDMLVHYLNSGSSKDVDGDMAHIRSYIAGRTSVPFVVELS